MENRLKLKKISKMFQSCHSKNTFDVSAQPFFFPENPHHRQLIDFFSPKPHSFYDSKCHLQIQPKPHLPHPKISHKNTSFQPDTTHRKPEKLKKKKPHHWKPKKIEDFSSATDNYYYDWRSSDEEDQSGDEATLFSSRSLSSESSGSFRKNRAQRKSHRLSNRTTKGGCKSEKGPSKKSGKLVKDSFAVVKKSKNPHGDFRVSMVEMILEKQIFGAEDLENLLECFISLNSEDHHRVIFEVFTEIWEALFCGPV